MKIYFKEEWLDAISFLSSDIRGKIFDAVFTYIRRHELPKNIEGEAKVAFLFIKREIDKDEARREAARRRKALREGKIENVEQPAVEPPKETPANEQPIEDKSDTKGVGVVLEDMGPNPEKVKKFLCNPLNYTEEDLQKFRYPAPWILFDHFPKERAQKLVQVLHNYGATAQIVHP